MDKIIRSRIYSRLNLFGPFIFGIILVSLILTSCSNQKQSAQDEKPIDKIESLNVMIDSEPLNSQLRYERAELFNERGNYGTAIEDLRVAILRDSLVPKYYTLLSDVFMNSNNSSKALLTAKTALDLFPQNEDVLMKTANIQMLLKQNQESLFTINELLRIKPATPKAYFLLGLNFRALGDETRAINSFQTATEMDNSMVDAWIILGKIFEAKKQPIAERYFSTAVEVAPDNVFALHNKAYYLQNNGREAEAIHLYTTLLKKDSTYIDAHLNLGVLRLEQDSLDKAYSNFNSIVTLKPKDLKGLYFRAYTLSALGKKTAAITDLKTILNIDSTDQKSIQLLKTIQKG